jgi:hypothetical protein
MTAGPPLPASSRRRASAVCHGSAAGALRPGLRCFRAALLLARLQSFSVTASAGIGSALRSLQLVFN